MLLQLSLGVPLPYTASAAAARPSGRRAATPCSSVAHCDGCYSNQHVICCVSQVWHYDSAAAAQAALHHLRDAGQAVSSMLSRQMTSEQSSPQSQRQPPHMGTPCAAPRRPPLSAKCTMHVCLRSTDT